MLNVAKRGPRTENTKINQRSIISYDKCGKYPTTHLFVNIIYCVHREYKNCTETITLSNYNNL